MDPCSHKCLYCSQNNSSGELIDLYVIHKQHIPQKQLFWSIHEPNRIVELWLSKHKSLLCACVTSICWVNQNAKGALTAYLGCSLFNFRALPFSSLDLKIFFSVVDTFSLWPILMSKISWSESLALTCACFRNPHPRNHLIWFN